METVLRAAAIYVILLVILRLAGKRTMSDITVLDFILLLIIAEATQQAMIGDDFSLTNAAVVILTLVGIDIAVSWLKHTNKRVEKVMEGTPVVIVDRGVPLRDRMDRARVTDDDVLEAGRRYLGLERMDQVKYAVLERHGGITVVPWRDPEGVRDRPPDR